MTTTNTNHSVFVTRINNPYVKNIFNERVKLTTVSDQPLLVKAEDNLEAVNKVAKFMASGLKESKLSGYLMFDATGMEAAVLVPKEGKNARMYYVKKGVHGNYIRSKNVRMTKKTPKTQVYSTHIKLS